MTSDVSEPINVIEIGLDYCSLTYGVAPCTASGASGSECYQCFKTCQDQDNFTRVRRWHRFIDIDLAGLPPIAAADVTTGFGDGSTTSPLPAIVNDPEIQPTTLNPGKGAPSTGRLSFKLQDQPYHDTDLDPYHATRSYTPIERGTYFGKLRARHYVEGRPLRHYVLERADGSLALTGATVRTYIIDRFEGPDEKTERVDVVVKDPMRLLDGRRHQYPTLSTGELAADISAGATSMSVDADDLTQYPASGWVRVGDEVMAYSRSGNQFAITRAQKNTAAEAHSEGDLVQWCARINGTLDSVIADRLTGAGAEASWIDSVQWAADVAQWRPETVDYLLTEPTPTRTIVDELTLEHGLDLFWDPDSAEFKLLPLAPQATAPNVSETTNLVEMKQGRKDLRDKRISKVWVYFGRWDPTLDMDERTNYLRIQALVDASAESDNEYGEEAIQEVFCRTIDRTQADLALSLASSLALQYRDTPVEFSFAMGRQDAASYQVGDLILADHFLFQDASGANVNDGWQITSRRDRPRKGITEFTAISSPWVDRWFFIAPDAAPDFDAATDAEKLEYGYITQDDGLMPDGSDPYKIMPG